MEQVRVNKYLAEHGVCSRRAADKLIDENRITINGQPAKIGQTVSDDDDIRVDGKVIEKKVEKVILAFYKPVGVTVSEKDDHAETLICDIIDYPIRLTYAGRLDKDSEGLILLTNDGDFINATMKASNNHEKEYVVTLDNDVNEKDMEHLRKGIVLKELDRKTKKCTIERIGKRSVSMVLTEGLNRQIRRMWKAVGYEVLKLKRVRIVNIYLGNLKAGQWRKIEGSELETLYKLVGLKR